MSRFLRLLFALTVAAIVVTGGQSAASASDGAVSGRLPATVDAQLQLLKRSATTVEYRRATASDRNIAGGYATLLERGSARPNENCSAFYLCLFADANGGGLEVIIPQGVSVPYLGNTCVGGVCYDMNDRLTSWENVSAWTYCWYYDANYTGQQRFMDYFGFNIRNVAPEDNDQASSVQALGPSDQRLTC
ncbi:hypothetical protein GCM10009765_76740 [Fodinicola feengrottensis]|uniref:Uncharacterized protein n=1 Tax=Fodinicola feengrottensis TaxID=435914 RepID=A0ABN2J2N0_9ACTN